MHRSPDTVFEVACARRAGRWLLAVPAPPGAAATDTAALQFDVADADQIPFAAADAVAAHCHVRPWRLRLVGDDVTEHFAGERSGRRTRDDVGRIVTDSWVAIIHGGDVHIALRSQPA